MTDYISREWLLAEYDRRHNGPPGGARAMIEEAPAADVRPVRWIPVTERLPGYGDWVLGIGPKHGYHVCEYRGITHFPYGGDSPWFSAKGRTLTITHWMSLPEPPKKEDGHDRDL